MGPQFYCGGRINLILFRYAKVALRAISFAYSLRPITFEPALLGLRCSNYCGGFIFLNLKITGHFIYKVGSPADYEYYSYDD